MRRFFSFLVAIFTVAIAVTAHAQTAPLDLQKIIQEVSAQRALMQSASADFTLQSDRTPDFARVYKTKSGRVSELNSQEFSWAFKGDKFYTYSRVDTDFSKPQEVGMYQYTTTVIQYDGKKQYNTLLTMNDEKKKQGQVNIAYNRQHTNEWSPLFFGYQIPRPTYLWLDDALKSGDYKIVGTSQDAKFGTLLEFSGSLPVAMQGQEEIRFWLAPNFGYLMVRQRETTRALGREQNDTQELLKVEKRGKVWFPIQGTASFYEVEDGKPILLTQKTLTVTNFSLNDVQDSLFVPKMLRGAILSNRDSGETWDIASDGTLIPWPDSGNSNKMLLGWIFVGSLATLLFAGVMVWRKRRKRRKGLKTHYPLHTA